ncbi:TIGR02922 family protein [Shewanella marisflavi]|uniref:TIGR02922 family protein n=1 Tax=Shewanella marisflavi TaxID=260364 RepID=UPI003AAF656B
MNKLNEPSTAAIIGNNAIEISVLYICQTNLSIKPQLETLTVQKNPNGRVIIPAEFKAGKSILAVMEGRVKLLNSLGDRAEHNRENQVA